MENQHRKISGYRELSQGEIDLVNEIKAMGPQLESLILRVRSHLEAQIRAIDDATPEGHAESERLLATEPGRWAAIAKTHLQEGLMALTRAVAQPTFF